MIDCRVQLGSGSSMLCLQNPIMTASGTFGYGLEFMDYGDIASLGALVLKGISLLPRKGNPMPRIAEVEGGLLNAIGLQNYGVHYLVTHILPQLQKTHATIIANLYATSIEEFEELATILSEQSAIHALELNVSCPNVHKGGLLFGQDKHMLATVVKHVVRASKKHVCVKLTPNVTDIVEMARIAEDNGAHSLTCINTLQGMAVDIYSRKPKLAHVYGGLSGPCIKPIALQCVHKVAQAVSIPVVGVGGIACVEDVLEFILVGAHAIQIGTATFTNPTLPFQLLDDLITLCKQLGIERLEDYRNTLVH